MQLKIIVQLHIIVKHTRKTVLLSVRLSWALTIPTDQACKKSALSLGLNEPSQIERNRYLDKCDSIHVDDSVHEHELGELLLLHHVDIFDVPSDSSLGLFHPESQHSGRSSLWSCQ